ncbi:hypothetical protein [Blastococcus sp. URHD0036]|uniref:hypothetical protein n=1 Tax=Blastococcus sp. URHD0036 TaxID=1380356 RepID=UPI000496BBA4|nr:hypothetical protein [Blastococcus sp. URHD0036]
MPKGILYVETRPSSAAEAADYHRWYEETHLGEVLGVEGVVSARRFAPFDEDAPFVAIYEIEADDLQAVQTALSTAARSGQHSPPVGLSFDPPPRSTLLREIARRES